MILRRIVLEGFAKPGILVKVKAWEFGQKHGFAKSSFTDLIILKFRLNIEFNPDYSRVKGKWRIKLLKMFYLYEIIGSPDLDIGEYAAKFTGGLR